jgi:hypothetical protein
MGEIGQPEFGREGPVELGFPDEAMLQQSLVRGDTGKRGEEGGSAQDLGRMAVIGQESDLHRQRG